ncbi:MAG: ribulose-phosphate 3-epimerase, partial [Candidatus Omnitrophota bacterium]
MNKKILVAPSILSADFSQLGGEIKAIEKAGADWVHVDVMDGAFVPNITIGPPVIKKLRPVTELFFDVHLMIDNPGRYIKDFADAGSDLITVHAEACKDIEGVLSAIKGEGKKAGVSVKPGTDITCLKNVLDLVDLVLVMTVEPGFGGQTFMEDMMDKVRWIKDRFNGFIQVDGGINSQTALKAVEAGADVLVAGTAVFGNKDYEQAIKEIRQSR